MNVEKNDVLLNMCNIFEVIDIDFLKIHNALRNKEFRDFEDCL
jgi:hypothetical protein